MTQKAQNRQGKFIPNHRKRIHFEESLNQLPEIQLTCLPFDVTVTGEEVENG